MPKWNKGSEKERISRLELKILSLFIAELQVNKYCGLYFSNIFEKSSLLPKTKIFS